MAWHVRQNRALHRKVLALNLVVVSTPRLPVSDARVTVQKIGEQFWRAETRMGFMERPNIALVLSQCKSKGADIDLDDVTYYVGHETIVPREDGGGLPRWQEALFTAMGRNAARISDYLALPCDHVVEIGREIEI